MSDMSERERRPAIVAVDDEPAVWRRSRGICAGHSPSATASCARRRGAEALEILRRLRTRGDQVALLIADQRIPGMSGTEYLVEARQIVPDASACC